MLTRKHSILFTAVLLLCVSTAVIAQAPAENRQNVVAGRPAGMMPMRLPITLLRVPSVPMLTPYKMQLGLTDEQQTKIEGMIKSADDKLKPLLDAQTKASAALVAGLMDTKTDKDQLAKLSEAAMKSEAAVVDVESSFWLDFRSVLTPEQSAKLADMLNRRATLMLPPVPSQAAPPAANVQSPAPAQK